MTSETTTLADPRQLATEDGKPLWQIFAELAESVPDEEAAKLPPDLSERFEEYRSGKLTWPR